jgi:hypothetical protein
MHPLVRDLYKRFLIVGKDYPGGLEVVRRRAKIAFFEKSDLTKEVDIKKAVARGRYMVRELIGITQLKKYRMVKTRYEK